MLSARRAPTLPPMVPPVPALVAVMDASVLARQACRAARDGRTGDGLVAGLATTGRSNVCVGAHVPAELVEHVGDVAGSVGVEKPAAASIAARSKADLRSRACPRRPRRPVRGATPV